MNEVSKSLWATKLFTAEVHHQGLSIATLQQKMFTNLERRLNFHYLRLFDFPQDRGAVTPLGHQLFLGNVAKFLHLYRDAARLNHGCLLVDIKKDRDQRLRFRRSCRDYYIDAVDL